MHPCAPAEPQSSVTGSRPSSARALRQKLNSSANGRVPSIGSFHVGDLLIESASADRAEELSELLEQLQGEKKLAETIDFRDEQQCSSLWICCSRGHPRSVAVLLRFGADINAANGQGETPAFIAKQNGHGDCFSMLQAHGGASLRFIPPLSMRAPRQFDQAQFHRLSVLGAGSFGVVTLAKYDEAQESCSCSSSSMPRIVSGGGGSTTRSDTSQRLYALKTISKAALIKDGHQRHVIDERNILFALNDPFCLKLFGTFQTAHELILVTEAIEGCDLWSVIHEQKLNQGASGVPHDVAVLYMAGIIFALDHIHSKKIVFRDLKPENIMIRASTGYPCLIDFGFAKRVPYETIDRHGSVALSLKTYTLCGTPEYVSPEVLLNAGHDQTSDLWGLGVLFYEMVMSRTPFLAQKKDDITQLFTNIVTVGKHGVELSTKIDVRTDGTPNARQLMQQLFRGEPSDRLNGEKTTRGLLNHSFFSSIQPDEVYRMKPTPSFVPTAGVGIRSRGLSTMRVSDLPKAQPFLPQTKQDEIAFDLF